MPYGVSSEAKSRVNRAEGRGAGACMNHDEEPADYDFKMYHSMGLNLRLPCLILENIVRY